MFRGSMVAIVTPMLDSGEVDYNSFSRLLDWQLSHDIEGIVVLGTTGESATVEDAEREELIRMAVDQIDGRVPVIIGTGANSTAHAIQMTAQAKALGADAALLVTPYYNKPTQTGLYLHYKEIANAVAIPQILYNVPSRTACDLLPETVIELAKISNIVAIKEATGQIDRVKQIKASGCELDLLSGDDFSAVDFMLAGGKGVVSVAANIAPKQYHEMCAAALTGNAAEAQRIHQQLKPLFDALFLESNPIPAKWALHTMGMIPAGIRLPLTPLAKQFQDKLQHAMQHVGI